MFVLIQYIMNRIAAIRETFEESGVLLLQPDDSGRIPVLEASEWVCWPFVKMQTIYSSEETAEWRLKVQDDPGQLLELCRCFFHSQLLHYCCHDGPLPSDILGQLQTCGLYLNGVTGSLR